LELIHQQIPQRPRPPVFHLLAAKMPPNFGPLPSNYHDICKEALNGMLLAAPLTAAAATPWHLALGQAAACYHSLTATVACFLQLGLQLLPCSTACAAVCSSWYQAYLFKSIRLISAGSSRSFLNRLLQMNLEMKLQQSNLCGRARRFVFRNGSSCRSSVFCCSQILTPQPLLIYLSLPEKSLTTPDGAEVAL